MWATLSAILFYGMFTLLLYLLWQLVQNLKIYGKAWMTLIGVHKQNADSMQKVADAVYILAQSQEKPVE